jgi:hypothetical protein
MSGGREGRLVAEDCVVGGFTGYGWDEVRVWARSLGACGFTGRKVALLRAPTPKLSQSLVEHGIDVVDFTHSPAAASPYVDRFIQLRRYLANRRQNGQTFRWVVMTDVGDLCFQGNPIDYLARFDPPRLVLSLEGLPYAFAEWNFSNLRSAFGIEALDMLRMAAPSNVGVLAGGHAMLEGLALLIEQLARAATDPVAAQAALNLLVEGSSGSLWLHRAGSDEPWACQAGVMADPRRIERNRPHLLGPEPVWRDGRVLTAGGEPYAIVHQYDRVPLWNAAITARYAR